VSEATSQPRSTSASTTTTWAALRRFWPYAWPHRRWLWVGLAMIPVVAAVSALRPLLVKWAIDDDIATGDALGLRFTAMLFLVAVMAEFFASAVQVYALQRVGYVTISDLRRAIFLHVIRLPARFYDRTPIGSLLSRSTSDVEALSETLAFGVFTILTDIAVILSIVAAMFVLDARLTLISLAVAPLLRVEDAEKKNPRQLRHVLQRARAVRAPHDVADGFDERRERPRSRDGLRTFLLRLVFGARHGLSE